MDLKGLIYEISPIYERFGRRNQLNKAPVAAFAFFEGFFYT